jgi:hypothetical protein
MGRNETNLDYDVRKVMTTVYHVVDGSDKIWGVHWKYSEAQKQAGNLQTKYPHLAFTIKEVVKAD